MIPKNERTGACGLPVRGRAGGRLRGGAVTRFHCADCEGRFPVPRFLRWVEWRPYGLYGAPEEFSEARCPFCGSDLLEVTGNAQQNY